MNGDTVTLVTATLFVRVRHVRAELISGSYLRADREGMLRRPPTPRLIPKMNLGPASHPNTARTACTAAFLARTTVRTYLSCTARTGGGGLGLETVPSRVNLLGGEVVGNHQRGGGLRSHHRGLRGIVTPKFASAERTTPYVRHRTTPLACECPKLRVGQTDIVRLAVNVSKL